MIDTSTPRGRLVEAALQLAAEKAWSEVSLLDIAERAGLPLDEVRKVAGSKVQIVAAFMRSVDDAVLKALPARTPGLTARDTLFEVVMARFDALMPHKPAIRSISKAGMFDTNLIMPFLNSQRWMLQASGIDGDGISGLVRTTGLGTLYARVFSTWLEDDDPGMAKTMAALDRRLRSAESTISTLDTTVGGVVRIARDLPGVFRSVFTGARTKPTDAPKAEG